MKRATAGTRSLAVTIALGLALVPAIATAQDEMMEEEPMEEAGLPVELSGNVGFFSDYRFRGVSQTGEEFALQGGMDLGLPSGLYVGTWASNVEFGGADDGGNGPLAEVDIYGGWGGDLGPVGVDVGAIFFLYPGDESLNYWEFPVSFGFAAGPVDLSAGVVFSPDYFAAAGFGMVFSGGAAFTVPLPEDAPVGVGFDANINYTTAEDEILDGEDSYLDWNIGVTVSANDSALEGLFVDLRYVDTDLSDVDGQDAGFVWGVGYSF